MGSVYLGGSAAGAARRIGAVSREAYGPAGMFRMLPDEKLNWELMRNSPRLGCSMGSGCIGTGARVLLVCSTAAHLSCYGRGFYRFDTACMREGCD